MDSHEKWLEKLEKAAGAEKGKSGRGLGLTPGASGTSSATGASSACTNLSAHTGTKKLAEQELQNLSKPRSNSNSGGN